MSNDKDKHPEELLPWLANDTLEGLERQTVEQHVAHCAFCQSELALLKSMHAAIKAQPMQDPGEIGLGRLMRDVRMKSRESRLRWLVPAAIAASIAITVPAVLLLGQQTPVYVPLAASNPDTPLIQVQFASNAKERDMQTLLRSMGAHIIDGPSAAGVYRIMVEPSGQTQAAIELMRTRTDLVSHVALEP